MLVTKILDGDKGAHPLGPKFWMLVTDFVSHIVAHIMTSLKLHNLCSIMKNKVPTQLRVVLIMDNPY